MSNGLSPKCQAKLEPKCKDCMKAILVGKPVKSDFVCKYEIPEPPRISNFTGLLRASCKEEMKCFGDLPPEVKELINHALAARLYAYVPYSNLKVGAAFRTTDDGNIFSGCNVENAAFTPTCCAERTALLKAVSEGYTRFCAGAIVAFQPNSLTTPCGVCRQFIMEFACRDIPIYITKADDNCDCGGKHYNDPVFCTSIYNLLPHGFRNFKVDDNKRANPRDCE